MKVINPQDSEICTYGFIFAKLVFYNAIVFVMGFFGYSSIETTQSVMHTN